MQRPSYLEATGNVPIASIPEAFDPHLVGTPPLGLDLPASDIDVLCHAPDPVRFTSALWQACADRPHFSIRQGIDRTRPVIASFEADGWRFELFGATAPVHRQDGWRHFDVELRLLRLAGAAFRCSVMAHRGRGLKTGPAFAAALGLPGDPCHEMSRLCDRSDMELVRILDASRSASRSRPRRSAPLDDLLHSKIPPAV